MFTISWYAVCLCYIIHQVAEFVREGIYHFFVRSGSSNDKYAFALDWVGIGHTAIESRTIDMSLHSQAHKYIATHTRTAKVNSLPW